MAAARGRQEVDDDPLVDELTELVVRYLTV